MITPLSRKQLDLSETALADRMLVTPQEACRLLCVSKNTLPRLGIPVVRNGGLRRYDVADLRRWVEEHKGE